MSTPRNNFGAVPQGEAHWKAKLTDAKVREIRHMKETQGLCVKCIAHLVGLPYPTVWEAANYRTWRHVR